MANIQSNIKRNLQSKERNLLVHSQLSTMKTFIKKAQKSKDQKDLAIAFSYIDSALSKGIIKQNKADRLKSRLSIFVKKASAAEEKTVKKTVRKTSTSTAKKGTKKVATKKAKK